MRGLRIVTGLLAGLILVSCGGDGGTPPDVPTPGNLTVSLTGTVPTGAGAMMLNVVGATGLVDTLTPAAGFTDYSRRLNTKGFRTVLIGTLAAGQVAVIHVPDTRKASDYSATVLQVANGTTYAPMVLGSFTVAVAAP